MNNNQIISEDEHNDTMWTTSTHQLMREKTRSCLFLIAHNQIPWTCLNYAHYVCFLAQLGVGSSSIRCFQKLRKQLWCRSCYLQQLKTFYVNCHVTKVTFDDRTCSKPILTSCPELTHDRFLKNFLTNNFIYATIECRNSVKAWEHLNA